MLKSQMESGKMKYNTSLKEQSQIKTLLKYLYYIRTDLYLYFGGVLALLIALEAILIFIFGLAPYYGSIEFLASVFSVFVAWSE